MPFTIESRPLGDALVLVPSVFEDQRGFFLEAFRADPALRVVRASTVEIYGDREPPPQATLYFRGVDEEVGPMTKYAVTERHDDA